MADWLLSSYAISTIHGKPCLAIMGRIGAKSGPRVGLAASLAKVREKDRVWVYDVDAKRMVGSRNVLAILKENTDSPVEYRLGLSALQRNARNLSRNDLFKMETGEGFWPGSRIFKETGRLSSRDFCVGPLSDKHIAILSSEEAGAS